MQLVPAAVRAEEKGNQRLEQAEHRQPEQLNQKSISSTTPSPKMARCATRKQSPPITATTRLRLKPNSSSRRDGGLEDRNRTGDARDEEQQKPEETDPGPARHVVEDQRRRAEGETGAPLHRLSGSGGPEKRYAAGTTMEPPSTTSANSFSTDAVVAGKDIVARFHIGGVGQKHADADRGGKEDLPAASSRTLPLFSAAKSGFQRKPSARLSPIPG